MTDDYYPPDPPLSAEQSALVNALTPEQIQAIDDALMSNVAARWRKVARVVMSAMDDLDKNGARVTEIPDIFYAERIRDMLKRGLLEGEGDFTRMSLSEVRLP